MIKLIIFILIIAGSLHGAYFALRLAYKCYMREKYEELALALGLFAFFVMPIYVFTKVLINYL